jgi:hypothetical protein
MKKVIVATDYDSADEAIYVDGKKVFESSTVYACDIGDAVDGPIEFKHMSVELLGLDFPEDAEQLKIYQFDGPASATLSESKGDE